jgi:HK97 family phage prohead protease
MPVAPETAKNNAKRGLELRQKWERGGTMIGVARARDLSNGADLSISTIKRMASFNRHRQNYQPDKKESDGGPTAGTIAWLLWGGTAGIDWALRISNENKSKMKNKNLSFECKFEVKDNQEEDYYHLNGYGSTFGNVDRVNDVVEKGAFKKSLKKRMPKLLFGHESRDVPVGIIDSIKEDDNGLIFEARMPKNDAFVRDRIMPQIKIGSLNSFSIGYTIDVSEIDNKTGIRKLKEISLFEISIVTFPANEKATLQAFKNIEEAVESEEVIKPEEVIESENATDEAKLKKDCIDNIDSIRTFEKAIATKFSNQDAKMMVAKAKEIFQRDVEVKTQREAELLCELSLQSTLLQIKNI